MKFAAGALLFLAEKWKYCRAKHAKYVRQCVAIIALVVKYFPLSISLGFAILAYEDDTVFETLQKLSPKVALAVGITYQVHFQPAILQTNGVKGATKTKAMSFCA